MIITFPDTRDTVNAIRGAIGRVVTLHIIASTSGCYACDLDPINNTSTDPFCTVCGGVYWSITYNNINVSGHVSWSPIEERRFTTAGIKPEGDCTVTIEYTPGVEDTVNATKWIDVDGIRMLVHRYELRGHQQINRIRMILKEEGT
jgi:hypothetical protein